MNKSVPINSLNAIDIAAFVVGFDRRFSEEEETKLLSLEKTLEKELPTFSRDVLFEVRVEDNKILGQVPQKTGVKLQKIEPSGKVCWMLNMMENQLIIYCYSYDRWERVWRQTSDFIKASTKLLDLETLNVEFCALQYVDRFTGDANSYNIYDIFDNDTQYLTMQASNSGRMWHVHQGWFENKSPSERILNVLNLGAVADNNKIITTIDHTAHAQFISKKSAKMLFGTNAEYENIFLSLHQNNKKVISLLLNQKQKKAIKLDG